MDGLGISRVYMCINMCSRTYPPPYPPKSTKQVEESFNTQATHDLLFLSPTTELGEFDHLAFPGVVPRTFWGPLLLAAPAKLLAPLLDLTTGSK